MVRKETRQAKGSRVMTKSQSKTLEALSSSLFLRVVGWDTGVQGPLLRDEMTLPPVHTAITPRGKQVVRNGPA